MFYLRSFEAIMDWQFLRSDKS